MAPVRFGWMKAELFPYMAAGKGRGLPWLILALLLLVVAPAAGAMSVAAHHAGPARDTVRLSLPQPSIVEVPGSASVRVVMAGAEDHVAPGEPILPRLAFRMAVPEGRRVSGVSVAPRGVKRRPLPAPVEHGQWPHPLSLPAPPPVGPRCDLYGSDSPFPPLDPVYWRVDRLHGVGILSVVVTPVQYKPLSGDLLAYQEMIVTVDWETSRAEAGFAALGEPSSRRLRVRPRPGDRSRIERLLDLPLSADAMCGPDGGGGEQVPFVTLAAGALLAEEDIAYAIVAPEFLLDDSSPYNLQALADHRRASGLTVTNVPLEWVLANYDGQRPDGGEDNATRLRNFVIDAYEQWGLRYLVLAGNRDLMPYRSLYNQIVLPHFTYAANIPSDLYFGALEGDFDGNANGRYGERNDGPGGGDIDLLAEVQVGRLLVASPEQASRVVEKIIGYETAPPEQLRRVLHVGEHLGFGGVSEYAKPSLEQIRLGGSYNNYTTTGFADSAYHEAFDTGVNLYDMDGTWNKEQLLALWQEGTHVINHLGHGNHVSGLKLNRNDLTAIPPGPIQPFLYSQACELARYDDVVDCFAERLGSVAGGAFAAVLNTRFGWGRSSSTDGASHRYHRQFWNYVFQHSAYTLGQAVQYSRERLIPALDRNFPSDPMRWCYYSINLFGDPATPFARRVRQVAPEIIHAPLANHYPGQQPAVVRVQVGPEPLVQADSVSLEWRVAGAGGAWQSETMEMTGSSRFSLALPPQPLGTVVDYRISAATFAGEPGHDPASPEAFHRFAITEPRQLTITGDPAPFASVSPAYGTHQVASGVIETFEAPPHTAPLNGIRMALSGWSGTGSVPAAGVSNRVQVVVDQDSTLTWRWHSENSLAISSTPPSAVEDKVLWFGEAETASTPEAPARADIAGTTYKFAQWEVDGQRVPSAFDGPAANPLEGLLMERPLEAVALYLPAGQDSDGSGLADWWQLRYFGSTGIDPDDDPDGDGFSNLEEFQARSNPLDPESIPGPPLIFHAPLDPVQPAPPPLLIEAEISDPYRVESAVVRWSRNGGPWREEPLVAVDDPLFSALINDQFAPGDSFVYKLQAANPAGYVAQAGPFMFDLVYPEARLEPAYTQETMLTAGQQKQVAVTLGNHGNALLEWSWRPGLFESFDHVGADAGGWQAGALDQPWTPAANRYYSPPYSMHSHLASETPPGNSSLHAGLVSPPLALEVNARLRFRYWIDSEPDYWRPGYVWDGGIVEISTDGGQTFARLPGPYSHRISGWSMSPWPDGTPCFGGYSDGWRQVEFDLSDFAGQTVHLRFHNGADNNTDYEGWYVDDVEVGPLAGEWSPAMTPVGESGRLDPGESGQLLFDADAGALEHPDTRVPRYLLSNDPLQPVLRGDALLLLRHPPELLRLTAGQTPEKGRGIVTVTAELFDRDGWPCLLELWFSGDGGLTWRRPELVAVEPDLGQALIGGQGTVTNIATLGPGGAPATNRLTMVWDTRQGDVVTGVSPRTVLIARAGNAWLSTLHHRSPPFAIDNQPPDSPQVTSMPLPGQWSSNRQVRLSWPPVDDGGGSGVAGYRVALAVGAGPFPETPLALDREVLVDTGIDGSNFWLRVEAEDKMGNISAPALLGPFFIDATPPSAGNAIITPETSDFGPYTVGREVVLHGGGFSDDLSGIDGYQVTRVAPAAPAGVSLPVEGLPVKVGDIVADQDNVFEVRARDRAGNLSQPVTAGVKVLDPDGDYDGDGMTNLEEEIAGTDATDAASLFRAGLVPLPPDAIGVTWPAVGGRLYSLEEKSVMPGQGWLPVAGQIGLQGRDGLMTGEVHRAGTGLFRVRVKLPEP